MRVDIEVCGKSNICIKNCPEVLKFSGRRVIVKMDKIIERLEEKIDAAVSDPKRKEESMSKKEVIIMGDL